MRIKEIDYPADGLKAGWPKLSPDEPPNAWKAFEIDFGSHQMRCYLGVGFTSLTIDPTTLGADSLVVVLSGYVYVVDAERCIVPMPTKNRGYSDYVVHDQVHVANNYSEILIIERSGIVRYDPVFAVDDLALKDVTDGKIKCSGILSLAIGNQQFEIEIASIPAIKPLRICY